METVKWLLSKGANKDITDRWGTTPLSEINNKIEKNGMNAARLSLYTNIRKILSDNYEN